MHPKIANLLNEKNINHREIRHDSLNTPINSPLDFANAINYDLERITKSVFLRSKLKDKYVMAVCSSSKKLNLPKLAILAGANKLEVADKEELARLVGYPIFSVSSVGLAPDIQVFIDTALFDFPTVLIGSGEGGVEIEIAPTDLLSVSEAQSDEITITTAAGL